MAAKGQSAARLKALRKKYRLGEFSSKASKRRGGAAKARKSTTRKTRKKSSNMISRVASRTSSLTSRLFGLAT